MSGVLRIPIPRDPQLASEPLAVVARRWYGTSAKGSTRTLVIVLLGLAVVGLVGGVVWYVGGEDYSGAQAEGMLVLLGGALSVGGIAGLGSPPMAGLRSIAATAVAIVSLPVALAALLAIFGTGADRAWALETLALTMFGGAAMVACTLIGYAVVHGFRARPAATGGLDPITASVQADVQSAIDRVVAESSTDGLVLEVAEDATGRAWLELETRMLIDAGYREVRREKVTNQPGGAETLVAFVADVDTNAKTVIQVVFQPPWVAGHGEVSPDASDQLTTPEREDAGASPEVTPETAPDPQLAEEAERWLRTRAAENLQAPATAEDIEDLGAIGGVGNLVVGTVVFITLLAQAASLIALTSSPEPLQAVVGAVLIAVLPLAVGAAIAYVRGPKSWLVAIAPIVVALGLAATIFVAASAFSAEIFGGLAVVGLGLTVPWALGWLIGATLRRHRPGAPRAS